MWRARFWWSPLTATDKTHSSSFDHPQTKLNIYLPPLKSKIKWPGRSRIFLLQSFNIRELNRLSSTSSFEHLTLNKSKRFNILKQPLVKLHIWSAEYETHFSQLIEQEELTLISLVWISPSEATSWWVRTYLSHLERAFSLGADTLMALGRFGCMTVSRSTLVLGLWSTHLSPPAECERLCRGRTGGTVYLIKTQAESEKQETVFKPVEALVC